MMMNDEMDKKKLQNKRKSKKYWIKYKTTNIANLIEIGAYKNVEF